jgi:hypothetical protein
MRRTTALVLLSVVATSDSAAGAEGQTPPEGTTRRLELTRSIESFDADMRAVIEADRGSVDGLPVASWLGSAAPGLDRKSCLLNLLAKLRTTPDHEQPLIRNIESIFFVDLDRIYVVAHESLWRRLQSLTVAGPRRFYEDRGRLHPIHRRLIDRAGVTGYTLYSFRQGGKHPLQIVVAVPPDRGGRYYAEIDLDLANPYYDVAGLLIHAGEVVSLKRIDHVAMREYLARSPDVGPYIYYRTIRTEAAR